MNPDAPILVLPRPDMAVLCAGCGKLVVPSGTTHRIDDDRKPVCGVCIVGARWREWNLRRSR